MSDVPVQGPGSSENDFSFESNDRIEILIWSLLVEKQDDASCCVSGTRNVGGSLTTEFSWLRVFSWECEPGYMEHFMSINSKTGAVVKSDLMMQLQVRWAVWPQRSAVFSPRSSSLALVKHIYLHHHLEAAGGYMFLFWFYTFGIKGDPETVA